MYRPAKEDLQAEIAKDKHQTIYIAAIAKTAKMRTSYFNHSWT